jgi:hypothetical protein
MVYNKTSSKNKTIMNNDNDNDAIETSEDTADSEKGGLYPYDPTQTNIDIRESPHSIYELMRKYNDGRLIVHPELQTIGWTIEQKSHFIETVILGFPLPPFYVSQTREGMLIVIDGLQRISALKEFTSDCFYLTGLQALTHLNGKNFTDLKQMIGAYQVKIEDKKIILYVLKPSTNQIIIGDLLQRVNMGVTTLTKQELQTIIEIGRIESVEMLTKERE